LITQKCDLNLSLLQNLYKISKLVQNIENGKNIKKNKKLSQSNTLPSIQLNLGILY